jgi:hypothetical protein
MRRSSSSTGNFGLRRQRSLLQRVLIGGAFAFALWIIIIGGFLANLLHHLVLTGWNKNPMSGRQIGTNCPILHAN